MGWIITIGVLLALLFILLLFQLRIRIQYVYQKNNHHAIIHVYYLKLRIFHKKVNLDEQEPEESSIFLEILDLLKEEAGVKRIKGILHNFTSLLKESTHILSVLIKSMTIHELSWKTHLGTGDASSTGIITGGVWMIKGTLIGALNELTDVKCNPKISVTPHSQQRGLYSEVDCIVSIRLGKAIKKVLYISRKLSVKEVYS